MIVTGPYGAAARLQSATALGSNRAPDSPARESRMTRLPRLTAFALALALGGSLAACAAVQGQETTGQYVDDSTITAKVKTQLVKAQSLKGFDIHVETMQGTVQLSGFVDTRAQKDQAGEIAQGVTGVVGVQNNILVKQ